MDHTRVLKLEQRLAREEKELPPSKSIIKDFFVNIFSHGHYLRREMQNHTSQRRFEEAASCAIQLKQYQHAFTLYNQAVANGNWRANISAAELAESLGEYQRELTYRSQAIRSGYADEGLAGIAALRLGRTGEAQEYFRLLREGE